MQLVALARYEPAPHTEQLGAFSLSLYSVAPPQLLQVRSVDASGAFATRLPAAQVRQGWHTVSVILVPTSDAKKPSVHTACVLQPVASSEPANVPAAQAMQLAWPVVPCDVPIAHAWHAVEPLTGVDVPAGHAVHVLLLLAPTAVPILPGAQPMHASFWSSSWYRPAAQSSQCGAFSIVDTRPARHGTHSVPLTHVPGPQTPQ